MEIDLCSFTGIRLLWNPFKETHIFIIYCIKNNFSDYLSSKPDRVLGQTDEQYQLIFPLEALKVLNVKSTGYGTCFTLVKFNIQKYIFETSKL